jgi:hypothetical protein
MGRVIGALREASRVLLGRKPAGRALTVYPDDLFLTSYPRSGNTWARFLIANLAYPDQAVGFANIESLIPAIYFFPDRVFRAMPRPRIFKSHEHFDPRYRQVIYIVRDPRDVAVSYYHYAIKRKLISDSYPIEDFVPRFIAAEWDRKLGWAANWADHVTSWVSMRKDHEGFLFLRYEDLQEDTINQVARVAKLLHIEPTRERLEQAIRMSSAQQMRELEKQQSGDWILTKETRQDKPFVRAATSGGWRSALPERCVEAIETAWANEMQLVGYVPSREPVGSPPLHSTTT